MFVPVPIRTQPGLRAMLVELSHLHQETLKKVKPESEWRRFSFILTRSAVFICQPFWIP
jgi:hypothetical protein